MKKTLAFLFISLYTCLAAIQVCAEPVKLITDAKQLWSDCGYTGDAVGTGDSQPISVLIDGRYDTHWHSDYKSSVTHEHFIDVLFPDGLTLADGESIVVKLQRRVGVEHGHPTAFEIKGSSDPIDGQVDADGKVSTTPVFGDGWRYAFFTYRGSQTLEYSAKIGLTPGKTYYRLRFTIKATNTNNKSAAQFICMHMAEFQLYKLGKDDLYPDGMRDRFHLMTDMHFDYADYELLRTGGILDPKVRKGINGLDGWIGTPAFDADGKWTADAEFFNKHSDRLSAPDYTQVSKANDTRIQTDVKYQPTHVTEHELYAIPGDAVALYPFYGYNTISQYEEKFSHWYNYETGGNVLDEKGNRVLDFLINPKGIFKSDKYGWFGGQNLIYVVDSPSFEINSVEDWDAFVKAVIDGAPNIRAVLNADLDFSGRTVTPVGTEAKPFAGNFDGKGHTIRNLTINLPETNGVGLFGWTTTGAVIQNLILDSSCSITGHNFVGGFVGAFKAMEVVGSYTIKGTYTADFVNLVNHGSVTGVGNDSCTGGLLGSVRSGSVNGKTVTVTFNSCAVTGSVTGTQANGLLTGYVEGSTIINFKSCINTGTLTGPVFGSYRFAGASGANYTFEKCYSNGEGHGVDVLNPEEINTPGFMTQVGGNWTVADGSAFPASNYQSVTSGTKITTTEIREYGTIAAFFYPRDVEKHELQELDKEYYIAADFSQDISYRDYFDIEGKTITEPLINFRHIFHIKDGKKFADENCATAEGNRAYIRKNRRHITAEAGKYFQIRLNSPIPAEQTTRSRLYYKIDDTDYRRVCSMRIRVKDSNGNILKDINQNLDDKSWFFASEKFNGYGTRTIDGVTYYACGGGDSYFRMLACNAANAKEGTYTVQLVGYDYNGEVIIIPDGSGEELIIQELEITFLPKTAAVLVPESELKTDSYRKVTNEYLTSNYGEARDKIDFDQYMLYNELGEGKGKYINTSHNSYGGFDRVIWPVPWKTSSYSFGYNNNHDFNMYQVASHSDRVTYHSQATANTPADKNFGVGHAGLFDRRFYENEGSQRGFFYWVNASADPGVMGYLHLDDFCAGSTVHVSGWISEFSGGELANLTLNFIAVLKDKGDGKGQERVPLHSHTTGYVPDDNTKGTWLYFYASFVPIFTDKDFDMADVDHYEIELDNNCKNSGGADYAIDDIRVYLVKPVVYADQAEPICERTSKAEVKISAPFDVLMQSLGQAPAEDTAHDQELELYYSFVDYKKFKEVLASGKSSDEAFDEAVLRYHYRGSAEETHYGKVKFHTYFNANPEYHAAVAGSPLSVDAMRQTVNGSNLIAFNTRPEDKHLQSGKEYIVVLYLPSKNDLDMGQFDPAIGPTAAHYQIGALGSDNDCSKSCIFRVQSAHTIKIDGVVRNPNEVIESCRNQSPVVQVDLYGKENGKLELVEQNARFDWFAGPMDEFSEIQKDGVYLWDAINHYREKYPLSDDLEACEPTGSFTEADKKIIADYAAIDPTGATRPRLILGQSSYVFPPLLLAEGETERMDYVLAVPIPVKKEKYLVCTQPTEVPVTVRQRAPRLRHGLDIEYPAALDDVPLRISLAELKKTSTDGDTQAAAQNHNYTLEIPVYSVAPVTKDVTSMRRPGGGSPLYIAQTDDPACKDLSWDNPVGEVKTIVAEKDGTENKFQAVFYSSRITFREGYTYRFRFTFEENNTHAGVDGEEVCTGQDVFTIKVVPEYQKWTGERNLNWNNDRNWTRMASTDFHGTASEFSTDGSNDRKASFAPLDFTKAVIGETNTVPHLFDETTQPVDGFAWAYTPSENTTAGEATVLVQYDMVQHLRPKQIGVFCRPWYAHTCQQIHFETGSQIMNQQFLHYGKAWVDMEMSPSLWHTAAMPLQGVVAGDMYLPTAGARQETEYFKDINFSAATNNRFAPAVFQRSWNQASATVYKYPGDNYTEDARVETTWSHVYNDVRVPYSGGNAFSICTDLSKLGGTKPEKVLFRLPKADTFYDYYTEDGKIGDKTQIGRENAGRLSFDENTTGDLTTTVNAATDDNKYFLVGNPFMAHLDMAKFFEANAGVIEAKYWILTGDLQGAAVMSPQGTIVASTGAEAGVLPPLTGFFVEAKTPGKSLTVRYTADMISVPTVSTGASRADAVLPDLVITAVESGSTALVLTDNAADAAYSDSEDALFINDSSLGAAARVYTGAGGYALTVNVCPDIEGTEVGLLADEAATTVLRFDGVEQSGLMLYDAQEEAYHPLENGTEVAVKSAARGRLYLVSDRMDTAGSIAMTLAGRALTVTSVAGDLNVKVYNTSGALVDEYIDGGSRAAFALPQGVFIVEATDAETALTRKFLVR